MAILSGLLGHAGAFDPAQAREEYSRLLAADEPVEGAYKLVRDVILLTDRRILLIDKQGITGRKTEYLSIPYRSVVRFSVESAGHFDLDAELKIWVSGASAPIERTFNHKVDVYALQAAIAGRIPR
ncbi:PH domain-containing protein [Belnapia sp. F-4-1]|uniref:PH domain-containing protein n=1 Tax=Belnapia sp. F-4-1 TaxID=1545443 RepID=UPI0005B78137|nr:PH domain-containing protein [Belnapia sp. F-4-1]